MLHSTSMMMESTGKVDGRNNDEATCYLVKIGWILPEILDVERSIQKTQNESGNAGTLATR